MNFVLERLTQPEIEPVTLAEAKRHIKQFAGVTSEDDDITLLIQVAREWVEDYTGRALVDQSWRLTVRQSLPALVGDVVSGYSRPGYSGIVRQAAQGGYYLRRSPILGITKVATLDSSNVATELDASSYVLLDGGSRWPRIMPLNNAWSTATDFLVEYRAGFADRTGSPVTGAEVVPAALIHAVKLVIANFDANREPVNIGNIVTKLPLGIEWLLAGQKCNTGIV